MAATKSKAVSKKASTKPAVKARTAKAAAAPAAAAKKKPKKVSAEQPVAAVGPVNKGKLAPKRPSSDATAQNAKLPKPTPASALRALTIGDTVPPFEALDQTGAVVTSASLAGAPYVIYFYPKDDTPGCTTQACGFRDEMAVFAERGVTVLGVSPDSTSSHARFAQKYGLGFTLLADTEKKLVTMFGVWKLKQNYGREYWGVERSTFVVDSAGKIAKQWRGVKVAGHIPAVLEAVSQL